MVEVAVSYDGTWSKRGYTANFGVGFIVLVESGEVLDYDFESKLCMECITAKQEACHVANKIWERSKTYNLQCKFMVVMVITRPIAVFGILMAAANRVRSVRTPTKAPKNTKHASHAEWKESHDSGEADCCRVMKLYCIGHVQKKMGTLLRDMRKKTVSEGE